MEKFGHFFEFIAALNSVYIVSDTFLETMLKKINSQFDNLRNTLGGLKKNQENNVFELGVQLTKLTSPSGDNTRRRLTEEGSSIQDNISTLSRQINEAFNDPSMFKNFNYWCLFGCLYSLLILLIIGTGVSFEVYYIYESYMIFNTLVLLLMLYIIRVKTKPWWIRNWSASYHRVVLIFFFALIVAFVCYEVIKRENFDLRIDLKYTNMAISVFIPIIHFIYYYFKTTINAKRSAEIIRVSIAQIEERIETFSRTIVSQFQIIDELIGTVNDQT